MSLNHIEVDAGTTIPIRITILDREDLEDYEWFFSVSRYNHTEVLIQKYLSNGIFVNENNVFIILQPDDTESFNGVYIFQLRGVSPNGVQRIPYKSQVQFIPSLGTIEVSDPITVDSNYFAELFDESYWAEGMFV